MSSTKEFVERMDEDFDYMVTPLVFNVCLRIKCEGNSCQIEKVFGSNDLKANELMKSGEISRIHTLFPAKKRVKKKRVATKGGIQLIKLKKNTNDDDGANINVEIVVTFEDRNGKKYKTEQIVTLDGNEKDKNANDMIEDDDDEEEENDFYDNTGIRKAILLCRYVDLMKKWIDGTPSGRIKVNDKYKDLFRHFMAYFKKEMKKCDDNDMQKEVDLMQKLNSLPTTSYNHYTNTGDNNDSYVEDDLMRRLRELSN